MKALVSGASGFIGSALVARLVADGDEVVRLVRHDPRPSDARLDLDRRLVVEPRSGTGIGEVDVVFHLAGEPITPWRWSAGKRERIRSSRVTTTDVLARAVAALPGRRPVLVVMSAVGYYGDRGEELLDERSSPGSGTLAEVCRAWEEASGPAAEAGARVVNLRAGLVLGPGGGLLRLLAPLSRAGLGARLGSGRQWSSWISMEDMVGALLHVATRSELSGPCNATSPAPVRNEELVAALASALGRRARLAVPATALRLLSGKEVADEMLLASQRVLPSVLERSGYCFVHPTLDEALLAAFSSSSAAGSRGAGAR